MSYFQAFRKRFDWSVEKPVSSHDRLAFEPRALFLCLLASCGFGTAGALSGSDDVVTPSPVAPGAVSPIMIGGSENDTRLPPISFSFDLADPDSAPMTLEVNYLTAGGQESPAVLTGDLNLIGLPSSPAGIPYTRAWDFVSQVPGAESFSTGHRLVVRILGRPGESVSAPFSVGNDPPVITNIVNPVGALTGLVPITFDLSDTSDDTCSVLVEYDVAGDAFGWLPATPSGSALSNIATTDAGVPLVFLWNSIADVAGLEFDAMLRFTPVDDLPATGETVSTSLLHLDNNLIPILSALTVPLDLNEFRISPLSFDFTVTDPEGDPADIEILYLPPGGGPAIPALLTGNTTLTGIVASPTGTAHTRVWDFASQVVGGSAFTSGHALLIRALDGGSSVTTIPFNLGNDAPVVSNLTSPPGIQIGQVPVDLMVSDSSNDPVSVLVEYDVIGDLAGWLPATAAGGGLLNVAATDAGVAANYLWDSGIDLPGLTFDARLRFTPMDDLGVVGNTVTSPLLSVENNSEISVSNLVLPSAMALRASPLSFDFTLTDQESDTADVELVFLPPGGGPEVPLSLIGDTNTSGLATSPAGTVHTRQWDFANQLVSGAAFAIGYRLEVRVTGTTSEVTSPLFNIGNDAPVVGAVMGPLLEAGEIVTFDLSVSDSSSDVVSVLVEYDNLLDGAGYLPATAAGPLLSSIIALPGGTPAVFFWNAEADEPAAEFSARLRFTPSDGTATGTPVTFDITVDNNASPLTLVAGSAFFATPDDRRGIPLPVTIVEEEGDPLQLVVQWRRPFESFPALPASPAALETILADPLLRRQHQIATEMVSQQSGRVIPTGSADIVGLPELGGGAARLQSDSIAGRRLELLRHTKIPAPVAATWTSNPLLAPVSILERGDSVLVLEPSAGGWRLIEVELATGNVLRTITSVPGRTPNVLAESFANRNRVLLADEMGGTWRLSEIDLETGAVSEIVTASGATELGSVKGLAASGTSTSLLTVGNSLVQIDATNALVPTESTLFADFENPQGIVFDRDCGCRVFLAERDWTDPGTMNVTGRIVGIDLSIRRRWTIVASGAPFVRPVSVALERNGARLVVVSDQDVGDAFRELRAVDLAGGDGGGSFEITDDLDADATSLVTGSDGLRVLALQAAQDLAVGGGIAQTRTVLSFDSATLQATVDSDFAPAPSILQPWRIRDVFGANGGSAAGIEDVFIWDSRDLLEGGQAVLRVTPYDSEAGLATNTSVPRLVRAGVDVDAALEGGAGTTDGVSGLQLIDINGDGELDLATANEATDEIAIFFQNGEGDLPATPDITLSGIPIVAPTSNPSGLVVIDADQDGDLDVVAVNRGSNNFNVFVQTLPGLFTTLSPLLVLGLDAPADIAAGDVNDDGRLDVVVADEGDDEIEVFFQLLVGLFGVTSSVTLGDATTLAPVAVAVADLDSDGDLDIVSCNAGSHNVTIFLQTAPGAFLPAPSFTLGGPGVTDDPSDVIAADLDGDGLVDVASANRGSDNVTVFRQTPAGFSSTPSHVLTHSTGPIQPEVLAAADLNGDGTLDLTSANGNGIVTTFFFDAQLNLFGQSPLVASGGVSLGPLSGLALGDLDGEGLLDMIVSDAATDELRVFFNNTGSFFSALPDLELGDGTNTPQSEAVATGDFDSDGDLDLASANAGNGTITIFEQFSPAVFGSFPAQTLSSDAETPGVKTLAARDLNGDGRVDLVAGSNTELAIFWQLPTGQFALSPDLLLGNGFLGLPSHIIASDLDNDGDIDLATAEFSANRISIFFQSAPGVFPATPDRILGNLLTTPGPVHLAFADVDADGDNDLISANALGGSVSVFLQSGGNLPLLPNQVLGGLGATDGARSIAVEDFDGDGDLDLAVACRLENAVALFFQSAPGVFPIAPSQLLTDAALSLPTTIAVADLDHDGDQDLVTGNEGSDNLLVYRQTTPGMFAAAKAGLGSAGSVDGPRSLIVLDLDGDSDVDLISAHPSLDQLSIFYASH